MAETAPSAKDILIVKPPSGRTDADSVAQNQTEAYTAQLKNAKLSRQHREVLLGLISMNLAASITKLNQTISAGYVQAEVQAISTKLDAVIDALNTLNTTLTAVKTSATTNLKS